jgi:hypothetical protein
MMLKATRGLRLTVIAATTLVVATFAGLASAGSAFADHAWNTEPPVLNGDWAPFNRCPIDDPAMLAVPGVGTEVFCIAESSPSGSMTFGNLTVPFKATNHQYGVLESLEGRPSPGVSPAGGILDAEPVELPGGIRELLCPSHGWHIRHICRDANDQRWHREANAVTWTLESAGNLTNWSLFAGLQPGVPIATVPLRIHLQNRYLGDDCYVGSEAEPIVTQPASLALPEVEFLAFATNGTPNETGPMADIKSKGSQGASAFTVPAASGCGPYGIFDQIIDNKVGLPSSAATNSVTFNEGTTNLVGIGSAESIAPNDGKDLSEYWHSAVLVEPEVHGSDHDGQQSGHRFWSDGEAEGYMRQRFEPRH